MEGPDQDEQGEIVPPFGIRNGCCETSWAVGRGNGRGGIVGRDVEGGI